MDKWIYPFIQSFVHTSAHTGRRGFYSPAKRATKKIELSLFILCFFFYCHFCRTGSRYFMMIRQWAQFLALWNLKNKTELWSFLKFGFLIVFIACTLASGREMRFYFVKTSDMVDRTHSYEFFKFTTFTPRRQPTTLVSARGPTAGTPFGNLLWWRKCPHFLFLVLLSHFRLPLCHPAERTIFY